MRFNGRNLETKQTVVKLRDNVEIRVSPIPLDLEERYKRVYPKPLPPVIVTMGKKEKNWDDPAFATAVEDWQSLQKYYQLWIVLQGSGVEFDTEPQDVAALHKLKGEVLASGLTQGEIAKILLAAVEASDLNDEKISEHKESF